MVPPQCLAVDSWLTGTLTNWKGPVGGLQYEGNQEDPAMDPTQSDLNKLAAKLAAIKAKKEALAELEAQIKVEAIDMLEAIGFTTVDCPKGKFQIRTVKSFIYDDRDKDLIKTAKTAAKMVEDAAKERATVLEDQTLAFIAAKTIS